MSSRDGAGDDSSVAGRSVAVIGGGLCGLTAAYRLKQAGFATFVLDRNDYAGGRVRSNADDGFVRDEGANIFPSSFKDAMELATELGLASKMTPVRSLATVETGEGSHSFDMDRPLMSILRNPELGPIDVLSLLRIVPPLLKYWKVLRFDDLSGAVGADTESAKAFCQRRITTKAYDMLINPLLRTIFAVNGDQISAATMLWILKGFAQARMQAFEGGMQTLATAISQQLDVRTGHRVSRVDETDGGVRISADVDGQARSIYADYCVIATDGEDLQALFGHGLTARQNQFLSGLVYMPLKMITFQTAQRPQTDALIVQVLEKCDPEVCIILINHNMHSDRAPDGKGTINFLGTLDWQLRMADKSTAESIDDARQRISRFLPVLKTSEEAAYLAWWPRGVITGPVGFVRQLAGFVEDMKDDARVFYAGEYLSQSSVNTAVATGNRAAARLAASATLRASGAQAGSSITAKIR